jgi:hypothetical protein
VAGRVEPVQGGNQPLFALGSGRVGALVLADAQDRRQPGLRGGLELECDLLVGLARLPALAVTEHYVVGNFPQHRG